MKKLSFLMIAILCTSVAMSQGNSFANMHPKKVNIGDVFAKIPNYDQRMAVYTAFEDSVYNSVKNSRDYKAYLSIINTVDKSNSESVERANGAIQKIEALSQKAGQIVSREFNLRFPEQIDIESEIKKVWGSKKNSEILFIYDDTELKDILFSERTPKMIADTFIANFKEQVRRCVAMNKAQKGENPRNVATDKEMKKCAMQLMDAKTGKGDITQEVIVELGY